MYSEAYVVDGDVGEAILVDACVVADFDSGYTAGPAPAVSYASFDQPQPLPNPSQTIQYMQSSGSEQAPPVLQPTCEPLPDPTAVRIKIVLFENERYSPRLGFSCRGLLINDRGIFSNDDGTVSFSTIDEASEQLISKGYSYLEDWVVSSADDKSTPVPLREILAGKGADGDAFGWLYNVDFASFASHGGHTKKGMAHFVRRRKLTREAVFNENALTNNPRQTCQSCDLRCIEHLVPPLADKIYKALRLRYGAKEMRIHKVLKMKSMAIDALFGVPQNTFNANFVIQQLEEFAAAQVKSRDPFIPLSGGTVDGRAFLAMFPAGERAGIVRALIRKHDLSYQYHCSETYCGTSCQFAVHRCPNVGCNVTFSRKWWGEHDANCPYKVVACPLQCGMYVARNGTSTHVANDCIMRPVPCPYARVGCQPAGLVFRDVEAHCSVNHEYHLSLSTTHLDALLRDKAALSASVQSLESRVQRVEAARGRRQSMAGRGVAYY